MSSALGWIFSGIFFGIIVLVVLTMVVAAIEINRRNRKR
jgi:hypothetical protein